MTDRNALTTAACGRQQTLEKRRQESLMRLRGMRPLDDTFMRCLFKDNTELTELVLRIILGKKDLSVTQIETQADMKRVTGARSICLDAAAADAEGVQYDIEIQRAGDGARPERARYHSSVLDVENLDAGQEFEELPTTYVIFITEKDVFGKGESCYIIGSMNFTAEKLFDDRRHIIYVNGAYEGDSDIGKLMHDFRCSNPDDMYYDALRMRSEYLKESKEGAAHMCEIMERALEQEAKETRLECIKNLMDEMKLTSEQAMNALRIPQSEQAAYLKRL